eukprot:3777947-Alexandrium_andersonii.AAC.1
MRSPESPTKGERNNRNRADRLTATLAAQDHEVLTRQELERRNARSRRRFWCSPKARRPDAND